MLDPHVLLAFFFLNFRGLHGILKFCSIIQRENPSDEVPLPLLYRVEPDGPITWFWMEYLGDDAAKAKLPVGMFRASRPRG